MTTALLRGVVGIILVWPSCALLAAEAAPGDEEIRAFLRDELRQPNVGAVVGLVDEGGTRLVAFGSPGNDGGRAIDGDTVFEIGSVTKTFTALLLQDMADQGEVSLDDPVQKYLPAAVAVPSLGDRPMTLLHLATQSSGLPFNPNNFSRRDEENPFADYSGQRLYAFLSAYRLKQPPGEKFSYSNVGVGLLGHALSLRAGCDYESLVVERVCRPLGMDDTRVTLTPALRGRLASGRDKAGKPAPPFEFQALAGAGALRSTANDLLKYVAAQAGLRPCPLTAAMAKTHVIRFRGTERGENDWAPGNSAMPWVDNAVEQPAGTQLLGHGGGTAGYSAFAGFDKRQRRGVVVLCNQQGGPLHAASLGWVLLQRRPLTRDAVADVMMHGREVVGIGVALELDEQKHVLRITKVYPNSPASEAGLSAGQIIRKIGDVPTSGKALPQCAALVRGPDGSKLTLEIVSADGSAEAVELTRHKVRL